LQWAAAVGGDSLRDSSFDKQPWLTLLLLSLSLPLLLPLVEPSSGPTAVRLSFRAAATLILPLRRVDDSRPRRRVTARCSFCSPS